MTGGLFRQVVIVKSNLDCIGLTNSLALWTFTDVFEEKGGAASIFHGGFGMINFQGLKKPSYHAYRMLHQLGNQKLYKDDYLFVGKDSEIYNIVALAYNYPKEYENAVPSGSDKREKGTSKKLDFLLRGLKVGSNFVIGTLDKDHGNIHNFWEAMGKPEPPTREEIKVMKAYADTMKKEYVKADKNGELKINHDITPWSLVLIKQIN